jgi:FkbM family methyltransferase
MSLFSLPTDLLYRLSRRYVDRRNGENNDDIATNGELNLLKIVLPQCRTVFDIGANVGDWAARALEINPAIRLHCFEPSSTTFSRLTARGLAASVQCNNFGLSSARGSSELLVFEDSAGVNSLYRRTGLQSFGLETQQRSEIVRLETGDCYCAERGIQAIDFCKVDVEGHELEVFKGFSASLAARTVRVMQFEYGGCNIDSRVLLKDLFEFLQPHGYALYKVFPDGLRQLPRYDQRLENFQYQNWVVVCAESEYLVSRLLLPA